MTLASRLIILPPVLVALVSLTVYAITGNATSSLLIAAFVALVAVLVVLDREMTNTMKGGSK
jgi:hypothetical protein